MYTKVLRVTRMTCIVYKYIFALKNTVIRISMLSDYKVNNILGAVYVITMRIVRLAVSSVAHIFRFQNTRDSLLSTTLPGRRPASALYRLIYYIIMYYTKAIMFGNSICAST